MIQLIEKWSKKYKKSINCKNPKGFSQKAHCAGKKKRNESMTNEQIDQIVDEEIEAFLNERCQKGYKTHPTRKTKKMFGRTYRNCVKAENSSDSVNEGHRIGLLGDGKFVVIGPDDEVLNIFDKREDAVKFINDREKETTKERKDPAKGTGKKPKGSGRRLYTDENPKDTVSVKFSSVSDIQDTFSKESFKNKSHKRQSQIINLVHQRVRAAYNNAKDPKVKARLKKAFDYAKKRKEASKQKTKRMRKDD